MIEVRRLLPDQTIKTSPADGARIEERGFDKAYRRAHEMTPEEVIKEVAASGILGRGGAAFPTGRKWQSVFMETDPVRYAVMNADESEPGTFKDRVLLAEDPFGPLIGLLISAYAVQARKAFIYIRGEYQDIEAILDQAIRELRRRGWIDPERLDVEIRRGAGAYVAGEETALFNSIEGFRPEPRVKPPYPTVHGLFGKPTLIQNVETLANISVLFTQGHAWYRQEGTEKTSGTKLFSVSGHVKRPGVYELPFGASLRDLVQELAGGISGSGCLQAILLGGAAGTFLTAEEAWQASLDYEPLRTVGASIGSGAVMVFDDTVDLREILTRLSQFFSDESCGQCVPCRIGSRRLWDVLQKDSFREEESDVRSLAMAMQDASICGLGQAAPLALLSYLDRPELSGGKI